MPLPELQATLANLARIGTLIKDRGYRQIWRFEFESKAYYLKFYRRPARLLRIGRPSPALREFQRLQALQKARIPAPLAVAVMSGFRLRPEGAEEIVGDAVLLTAIEPAVALDQYFNQLELLAQNVPGRRMIVERVIQLVEKLASAKLGHSDLHLGNMLMQGENVFLIDAYAVRLGGLKASDLLQLAHSVGRYATRADLHRGWLRLAKGKSLPSNNRISRRQWRKFLERVTGENRYFGHFHSAGWRGVYFKHFKYPFRWSSISRLNVEQSDWQREWPALQARLDADALTVLKRSRSGDVLAGEVVLAGRPLEVILKRPRRRYWYRYLNEIGRGARARRAWHKAWNLIVRQIPTAWPLLMMEKTVMGYVTDTVIIFERVPGKTLDTVDLNALPSVERDSLFRRTGRILRRIETFGFGHFDAKASNWIAAPDDIRGATSILIDVDGVRYRSWVALGIQRLLKSMREHTQYSVADSMALCQGYAPWARLVREGDDAKDNHADSLPNEECEAEIDREDS